MGVEMEMPVKMLIFIEIFVFFIEMFGIVYSKCCLFY